MLLPLSLISTALRTPAIRTPFLKLLGVRVAILIALALIFSDGGDKFPKRRAKPSLEMHASEPVDVTLPGFRLRIPRATTDAGISETGLVVSTDGGIQNMDVSLRAKGDLPLPKAVADGGAPDLDIGNGDLTIAGIRIPLNEAAERARQQKAAKEPESQIVPEWLSDSWAALLAIIATLSALEVVIVFFSRKWDDAISFELSRIAGILPEDLSPPNPRLGADFGWAYRKVKRKVRGTLVFMAGLPLFFPIQFVPAVGGWMFTGAATIWGWYWVGAFAAGKSAHAWADAEKADAPLPLRSVRTVSNRRFMWPVRVYVRLWERVTRELYPAVTTFEKNPRTFLGLGLTRVVFSIPILYLVFRPILPVAAGRICAESDPEERFSLKEAERSDQISP